MASIAAAATGQSVVSRTPTAITAKAPASETEQTIRDEINAYTKQLWHEQNIAELESHCQRYQNITERTPNGLWKLTLFQFTIDNEMEAALEAGPKGQEQALIDAKLAKWETAYPDSSCAVITRARAYKNVGWLYRGGGYIREASPENREIFSDWVYKAIEILVSKKSTASVNPDWYATMVDLAKTHNGQDDIMRSVIDEGLKRHPYYYPIYFNLMYAAHPKWGGSLEAMEGVARLAAELTEEKDGTSAYARAYWVMLHQYPIERFFLDTQVDWPLMKQGFIDMMERYPGERNQSAFARFACMAGDEALAKDLLRDLGDRVVTEIFEEDWALKNCQTFGKLFP